MNVLAVTLLDLSAKSGAVTHFLGIANGLCQAGATVTIVALLGEKRDLGLNSNIKTHFITRTDVGLFSKTRLLSKKVLEIVEEGEVDIVYLRNFALDYFFISQHLSRRRVRFVCEINTKIGPEYKSKSLPIRAHVYEWLEGKTLALAHGWLPVTNEIGDYAQKISKTRKPSIIARNGTDFLPTLSNTASPSEQRKITRRQLGVDPKTFVMVMLGFDRPWHGADRAVKMLQYMENTELWLIGSKGLPDEEPIQKLAASVGVLDRVKIFPWMGTNEAAPFVLAADIGLSALSIDLKELNEAQPMKVVTYLYLGLPVFTNHKDLRIDQNQPFLNQCISTDPRQLAAAILTAPRTTVPDPRATYFVVNELSWKAIGIETLEFLKALR